MPVFSRSWPSAIGHPALTAFEDRTNGDRIHRRTGLLTWAYMTRDDRHAALDVCALGPTASWSEGRAARLQHCSRFCAVPPCAAATGLICATGERRAAPGLPPCCSSTRAILWRSPPSRISRCRVCRRRILLEADRRGRKRPPRSVHRPAATLALDYQRRRRGRVLREQGGGDRRRPDLAGARRAVDRRGLHAGQPDVPPDRVRLAGRRRSTRAPMRCMRRISSMRCMPAAETGRARSVPIIRRPRRLAPIIAGGCWHFGRIRRRTGTSASRWRIATSHGAPRRITTLRRAATVYGAFAAPGADRGITLRR